jgi:hypothetical protein
MAEPQSKNTWFSVTRRGYDPSEVEVCLREWHALTRMLTADRDALLDQRAETARQHRSDAALIDDLRSQLRQLTCAPIDSEELCGAVRSILTLAWEDSAETRQQAGREAARLIEDAHVQHRAAEQLRDRLTSELQDVTRLRTAIEAVARRADEQARHRVDDILAAARAQARLIVATAQADADRLRSCGAREQARRDRLAHHRRAAAHARARAAVAAQHARARAEIARTLAAADAAAASRLAAADTQAERLIARAREAGTALLSAAREQEARAGRLLSDARDRATALISQGHADRARTHAEIAAQREHLAHTTIRTEHVQETLHARLHALRDQLDHAITVLSQPGHSGPPPAQPDRTVGDSDRPAQHGVEQPRIAIPEQRRNPSEDQSGDRRPTNRM